MRPYPWLIGDIGATNMRLARIDGPTAPMSPVLHLKTPRDCDMAPTLAAAIDAMGGPRPRSAGIAAAGAIVDGRVESTNSGSWLDARAATTALGLDQLVLINDFAALAAALPLLGDADVRPIGPTRATPPNATRLVIGAGTGFGVAASVNVGDRWLALASEAGHMPCPVQTPRDVQLARLIAERRPIELGRHTYDVVLSGSGLHAMAYVIATERGVATPATPEAVTSALATGDAIANEIAAWFAETLAAAAGDLALAFLPLGGVYLAGSLVQALGPVLNQPNIHAAFTRKGPQSYLIEALPLRLITAPQAALKGVAAIMATV